MGHHSLAPFSSFYILGDRLPTQRIQTHILRGSIHTGEANPGHRLPLRMLGSQLLYFLSMTHIFQYQIFQQ